MGRRGYIQIFERESSLAADKGIRILTLAVKKNIAVCVRLCRVSLTETTC